MRAIRYRGPLDFTVETVEDPIPGVGEVLVRPVLVGLCFTDRHWWGGTYGRPGGMIGGHEFSAVVVAAGRDAREDLQPGDRVSIEPFVYCRQCGMCRAGLFPRCTGPGGILGVRAGFDGGLAELCVVPDYTCFPIAESLTMASAASAEPACVATRAVRHGGIRIGDNVLVYGAEDYSLFVMSWLKSAGVNSVLCVDPLPHRRAAAIDMGASAALDPTDPSLSETIRQLMPAGADVAFTSTEDYIPASEEYVGSALTALRMQGILIPLRMYSPQPFAKLTPHDLWLKEIQVRPFGVFSGAEPVQGGRARGDWQVTLDAMTNGRLSSPISGTRVVKLEHLRTDSEVNELFESIPVSGTKILVEVSAE